MGLVPNVPTDYDELVTSAAGGDGADALLLARKSGKTPYDGAVLAVLARIAAQLEKANA